MEFKQNKLERQQSPLRIVKAAGLPEGQFQAILSTDDLDRHGERVSQAGLVIPKGQVIKMYYNHETNGGNLPIGKWLKVWKKDGKLWGLGEVDLEDEFAVKVYKKVLKGIIDSISIGFYPQEYDGETATWTKSTLVEASVVAEPANVNAVITSKTLGFTEAEFKKALKVKLKEVKADDPNDIFVGTPGKPGEPLEPDSADPPEEIDPPVVEADAKKQFLQLMQKQLTEKGGVADVLNRQDKWEQMEDFWEVVYAFADAYYCEDAKVTDFNKLLTECMQILQTIVDGTYAYEDEEDSGDASGDGSMTEVKSAIEELKSSVGALEAAAKASDENPAIKQLITVRLAAKQVDKTAENVNKVVRIKLKETSNV